MAYPYDGMFYPTLPQDTQDFGQVLSGVGRNLRDVGRGISYFPMDLAGAAADIGNLPLQGIDYLVNQIRGTDQNYLSTERPFGGSAQLIDVATKLGLSQQPTGSAPETLGRVMAGLINPMAGARAVGRVGEITTEQANRAADALVRQITGNPTATAPQVLQETSMPFMQAVAPKAPSLLEAPAKSDLGFYSALEQATIPLQNKGTGSQFLAQIEKTAGVKPDEIKWTGLDEFLKSKPNVTKAEVQDYLAANRVDLQEVQLGGPLKQNTVFPGGEVYGPNDTFVGKLNLDENGNFQFFLQDGRVINTNISDENFALRAIEREIGPIMSERSYEAKVKPKFSSYTLPGGQNYREILLTLPRKTVQAEPLDVSGFSVRTTENAMFPYTGQRDIEVLDSSGNVVSRRSGFRGTDDEAIQNYAGTVTTQAQKADESLLNYRSSHFDQPNILAHMRVNDRVVDGKNTLFIEEIQSDWHQAGRKKGYGPQTETEAYYITPDGSKVSLGFGKTQEEAAAAVDPGWKNLVDIKFDTQIKKFGEGVPDAPFKTTWHELSLKRAIQEASEKGYDQIAFTTGKTQAERYDLSKQISRVVYNEPGSKRAEKFGTVLYAYDKNGDQVLNKTVAPEELSDYIGKEAAERLTNVKADNFGQKELAGVDLQIGGEGMKGFYDQILPKSLEKLGKKFDAKVGKADMDGVEVWKMDITPKMRESVLTKGQPLFAATPALPALGLLGGEEE